MIRYNLQRGFSNGKDTILSLSGLVKEIGAEVNASMMHGARTNADRICAKIFIVAIKGR